MDERDMFKAVFAYFAEQGRDAGLVFRLDGTARLHLDALAVEYEDHRLATFDACVEALGFMSQQLTAADFAATASPTPEVTA